MPKTPQRVITNILIELDHDADQAARWASRIMKDLHEEGFKVTPSKIENPIAVDIGIPSTIPWVQGCHLCDSFKKEAADHAGLMMWVSAVGKHFDQHHNMDLYQDSGHAQERP